VFEGFVFFAFVVEGSVVGKGATGKLDTGKWREGGRPHPQTDPGDPVDPKP